MNKNKNFLKKAFAITASVIMGFGSAAVPVHGNPVAGAKLQILETTTDKDGNIVPAVDNDGKAIVVKEYTSTSDAAGIDISKDVMVEVRTHLQKMLFAL